MDSSELMNLDILMLVSNAEGKPWRRHKEELGIIHRTGGDLGLVRVREGWRSLRYSRRTDFGDSFNFPAMRKSDYEAIRNEVMQRVGKVEKIPERYFGRVAREFIDAYVFTRDEREITAPSVYLESKQNFFADPRRDERAKWTRALKDYLKANPSRLGLPPDPSGVYEEVELHNRLRNCLVREDSYWEFVAGNLSRSFGLTSCDLVFYYPEDEIYVIEIKTTMKNRSRRVEQCAGEQLNRAGRFFRTNFGVRPGLMKVRFDLRDNRQNVAVARYREACNSFEHFDSFEIKVD